MFIIIANTDKRKGDVLFYQFTNFCGLKYNYISLKYEILGNYDFNSSHDIDIDTSLYSVHFLDSTSIVREVFENYNSSDPCV